MELKAASQGVVSSIDFQVGDMVEAGSIVVVTELMKMLSEYKAPVSGTLGELTVNVGDMVEEGQTLAVFTSGHSDREAVQKTDEGSYVNRLSEELHLRRQQLSDEGRKTRVEKRHANGNRTARENITDLLDGDSFSELGGHALAAQHETNSLEQLIERSAADGVLVGTGTIDGLPVAVLVVDYMVMAGTQGHFHHKKVDRIIELAHRRKLPLILYPEGGGGRPNDVDAQRISVAQLEISSFYHLAALRGVVPMIAVVNGYCFAGSAAFAAVADVIIGTENASLGMGGPAMIEGGGLGSFEPHEVGPTSVHAGTGVYDVVVKDEAQATAVAKKLIHCFKGTVSQFDDQKMSADDLLPTNRRATFDMKAVVKTVFDDDSFIELKADYAVNMITGIARLAGRAVGVLANNCAHMGGAVDGLAADKAATLIELCQSHGLPIISLIDTPGFMVGPEAEQSGQVRPIGRFFTQGAKFDYPLLAVVVRRAYGLGAMAMVGGGFHAADVTLSWPNGEIGAMGIEGAVRLGARDHLAAITDDAEREAELNRMVDDLYERGKALNAATFFELDDVILPNETRDRLITTLEAIGK